MNRLSFFVAALVAFAAAPAGAQSISVGQAYYEPGETVTFVGDGFAPGEAVSLQAVGSTNNSIVAHHVTSGDDGGIEGSFALPPVYEAFYDLTATGAVSGLTAQVQFDDDINRWDRVAPTTSASATPVSCGAQVTVTAQSRGSGQSIAGGTPYSWTTTGGTFVGSPTGSSNVSTGYASVVWNAPAAAGTNSYSVEITGGGRSTTFSFSVTCSSTQTITFPQPADRTYGDPAFQVSATGGASGSPVTFVGSGQCAVVDDGRSAAPYTATVSLTGAGSCSVTASQAGGGGFNAATPVTRSFSIARASQVIAFPQPAGTTYGQGPVTLAATGGGSTSPVTFAHISGPCSVAGDEASITGAGTCAVRASQAGDANHNAAPNVDRSFSVAKANAVVSVTGFTGEYDGQPHGATGSATGVLSEDLGGLLTLGSTFTNVPGGTASWSFAGDANYNATAGSVPVAITKATATVDVTGGSFPYDGLAHAADVSTAPSVAATVTYDGSSAAPTNAGTYAVLATVTDPNYQGTGTGSIEITKVDQTVTWDTPSSIVYGTALSGAQLNATVAGVAGGSPAGALVYSPGSGAVLDAGTRTLRVDAAGTENYNAASAEVQIEVLRAPQTIAFGPLAGRTYGDADFAVGAASSAGAGLAVRFEAAGSCTVSGATVHLTGAGSCTVTALQDGDGNHEAAPAVEQTFVVAKADAAFTVSGYTGTYDGREHGATLVSATGVNAGDDLSGLDLGTSYTNAGSYTAAWSFPGNADYNAAGGSVTITINLAPLTVTADDHEKVYDGAPFAGFTARYAGFVDGEDEAVLGGTLGFGGAAVTAVDASDAPYAVAPAGLTSGNYAITFVPGSLVITRKAASVTPDAAGKTYGDAEPTLTGTLDGFVGSDAVTAVYSRAPGQNAGTYPISAVLSPAGRLGNYDVTYNTAPFTIERAPLTVTVDDQEKTYDGTPLGGFTVQYAGFVNGEGLSVLVGTLAYGAAESAVNAGTYAIAPSGLTSENYALTFAPATLTILQRPVTVTADARTKVYGEADPALTYQLTGGSVVGTDAFIGAPTRAPGEAVASSPYAILVGSLTLGSNYDLSFVEADLSITPRPITVTADAKTKVYGDADPTLTYTPSESLLPGNAFTGAPTRDGDENVGSYAVSDGDLSAGSNYEVTFVGSTFEITPRPVTVTADDQSKVYGSADPALTFQLTTGSLAFADAFTGALSRGAGDQVGRYGIGQGTLALSDNYVISFFGAVLAVTPATLTVTADDAGRVYGDANPAFTAAFSGFQYGEALGTSGVTGAPSLTTSADASSDVGAYPITAGEGTLAAGNYVFRFVPGSLTVTPRSVVVTPTAAQTKVYGEADPALGYTSSEALLPGNGFAGALTRATGEDVGEYAIGLGGLSAGTNYALSLAATPVTFEITRRPVTVTADAKAKVYGEADPALTYQLTTGSLVGGDAFSGDLSRTGGETVTGGPYAIGQNTLTLGGNYDVTFVGADLTITAKAASVTPAAATKVYGAADPTLTGTPDGFVGSDAVTAVYSRAPGQNAGTYTISATLSPSGVLSNYAITYNTGTFMIEKALLTVTAANASRTFGYANPTFAGQVSGFVNGDNASAITGSPVYTTTATTASLPGTYPITVGVAGMGASNYTFTGVPGTLTVTPYNRSAFLPPINTNGTRSAFKINSTVPVKFTLTDDAGAPVPASIASASFTFARLSGTVDPNSELETVATETPTPGGSFRFSDGQWHFNWGTRGLTQGTYRIEAVLNDGTRVTEFVELRR